MTDRFYDGFQAGVQAALENFSKKPRLMDALRDGHTLHVKIEGDRLTLRADAKGRDIEQVTKDLSDAALKLEKRDRTLAAKDKEIAGLRASLETKTGELRAVALAADRGEVKVILADMRR